VHLLYAELCLADEQNDPAAPPHSQVDEAPPPALSSPASTPEPGSFLDSNTLVINGTPWTFRTAPPPEGQRRIVASHPRLFLTQAHLPALRKKLQDPVYSTDMRQLERDAADGDPWANALLYHVKQEASYGAVAKAFLLSGEFSSRPPKGYDSVGAAVFPVYLLDWVMPLLTPSERHRAFQKVKGHFGYDHATAPEERIEWYWNDMWSRSNRTHYCLLALAIAGDGIDDAWANEVLNLAYSGSQKVPSPYDPVRGAGLLDLLMTISLDDGGGDQAGTRLQIGGGYYSFFLHAFLTLGAWETATGEKMWERCPFYQKLPQLWAYIAPVPPNDSGRTLEFITGIYRTSDPDMASLAKWMVDRWGRSKYGLVHRLILGDLRVQAKSPAELKLPLARYIRGADAFVSRSSWEDDATVVYAVARYLDTSRYEHDSGTFGIHKGSTRLAARGWGNKTRATPATHSGLWVYDAVAGEYFQGSTYWSGLNNYPERSHRADHALEVVTDADYFPGGPDKIEINDTYRAMSVEYSRLLRARGPRCVRRSIVHIPDGTKDWVLVYDYVDVPPSLKTAWSMRLAVEPRIDEGGFSIPGMRTSLLSPASLSKTWVGGANRELIGPPPSNTWHGNNRGGYTPGYSSDPEMRRSLGLGNLFAQPDSVSEQVEYLAVIEVTEDAPRTVAKISEREARFSNWRVSFSPDGTIRVVERP
jgi:hypothetical protein